MTDESQPYTGQNSSFTLSKDLLQQAKSVLSDDDVAGLNALKTFGTKLFHKKIDELLSLLPDDEFMNLSDDELEADNLLSSGYATLGVKEVIRLIREDGKSINDAIEIAELRVERLYAERLKKMRTFFYEEPDLTGLYETSDDGVITLDPGLFQTPGKSDK